MPYSREVFAYRASHSGLARNPLRRTVLVVSPPVSSRFRSVDRELRSIYGERDDVRDVIDDHLVRLQRLSGRSIPPVKLAWDRRAHFGEALSALLKRVKPPSSTRAVVLLVDELKHPSSLPLSELSIPHLVTLEISNARPLWASPESQDEILNVRLGPEKAKALLVDVALDIALFQSYDHLRTLFSDGHGFARRKVAFAVAEGLQTPFYEVALDTRLRYLPLAAAVRRSTLLSDDELRHLSQLWARLASEVAPATAVRTGAGSMMATSRDSAEGLARTLIAAHARGGQLSESAIVKAIEALPHGEYLFCVLTRRPRRSAELPMLRSLFRKARIRGNLWCFLPIAQARMYLRYSAMLSFLAFTRPAFVQAQAPGLWPRKKGGGRL